MITYNVSIPFLSPFPVFDLHFQQCLLTLFHSLTHTHTHTHTGTVGPLSLFLSLTHTQTNREKIPAGFDLFLGMKNQSVFIFFFINNSVSQFGSQCRQLG